MKTGTGNMLEAVSLLNRAISLNTLIASTSGWRDLSGGRREAIVDGCDMLGEVLEKAELMLCALAQDEAREETAALNEARAAILAKLDARRRDLEAVETAQRNAVMDEMGRKLDDAAEAIASVRREWEANFPRRSPQAPRDVIDVRVHDPEAWQ